MTFAEQLEQRGREKGRQEGRQEGREEGLEEGLARGRKEESLAIAQSMLARGLDLSLIEEVTGLSNDDLRALMH